VGYSTPPHTNRGLATPNNRLQLSHARRVHPAVHSRECVCQAHAMHQRVSGSAVDQA